MRSIRPAVATPRPGRPTPARRLPAALGATLATGGLLLLTASAASAHVTVSPSTTAAGAYSVLTFSLGHGCDGAATTRVSIRIPEEFATVTPTVNPGWTVEKVTQTLQTPVDDGHGGQYTERVAEVVYTAVEPLPDGFRDTFALQARLPGTPGETLVFPTVQTCEAGENAWIEVPADGRSADDLDSPAPSLVVTASEGGHGSADEATTGPEDAGEEDALRAEDPTAARADDGPDGPGVVSWVALVLGAGGLALGATALARSRTRS